MPELPDVELFKRYVGHTALHRRVERVFLHRGAPLLEGISGRRLTQRLRSRSLESVRRHGKVLFVGLDDAKGFLVLHFGMTGFLKTYRLPDAAPPHQRLVLELANGYRLAYDSQRLLGRIAFAEDPDDWVAEHALGPDALVLDGSAFVARLSGSRGSLKSALMSQKKIAGIGNLYSDEILFHARLHPRTEVAHLDAEDLRRLHRVVRHVLQGAIRYRADPDRMPRSWLLPHRTEGASCPRCGADLQRISVRQRSAWVCGRCQVER